MCSSVPARWCKSGEVTQDGLGHGVRLVEVGEMASGRNGLHPSRAVDLLGELLCIARRQHLVGLAPQHQRGNVDLGERRARQTEAVAAGPIQHVGRGGLDGIIANALRPARERAGAAIMLEESKLTCPSLIDAVTALLDDPKRLQSMSDAARRLSHPDAARDIAAMAASLVKETVADSPG